MNKSPSFSPAPFPASRIVDTRQYKAGGRNHSTHASALTISPTELLLQRIVRACCGVIEAWWWRRVLARLSARTATPRVARVSAKLRDANYRKLAARNAAEMTPRPALEPISKMFAARAAGTTTARWFIDISVVRPTNSISGSPWRHVLFIEKACQPAKSTTIGIAIRCGRRQQCNYASSSHNNTAFNDDLRLFYVPLRLILHRPDHLWRSINCILYYARHKLDTLIYTGRSYIFGILLMWNKIIRCKVKTHL